MLAYDENGIMKEFEENENIVICGYCKKPYYQRTTEQVPGFREVDNDVCPYCKESNGSSGDVEYFNRALTKEEISKLKK